MREHIFNINIIKLPLSVNTIANVNSEFLMIFVRYWNYYLHRILILLFTFKSTKSELDFHLVRGLLNTSRTVIICRTHVR